MNSSRRLGRGLSSLLREVDPLPQEPLESLELQEDNSYLDSLYPSVVSEPVDGPYIILDPRPTLELAPEPARAPLSPERKALQALIRKKSIRPRTGVQAARSYLEKIRTLRGESNPLKLDPRIDLTHCTMLHLRRKR